MDLRELEVAKVYFTTRVVQGFSPQNLPVVIHERTALTYVCEVEDDVTGYRRFAYADGGEAKLVDLRPGACLSLSIS